MQDDLLFRLDFRDTDPEVIDLSPERGMVATLKESKVECLVTDKVSSNAFRLHGAVLLTLPCI
jgi:hypothetical protein